MRIVLSLALALAIWQSTGAVRVVGEAVGIVRAFGRR